MNVPAVETVLPDGPLLPHPPLAGTITVKLGGGLETLPPFLPLAAVLVLVLGLVVLAVVLVLVIVLVLILIIHLFFLRIFVLTDWPLS